MRRGRTWVAAALTAVAVGVGAAGCAGPAGRMNVAIGQVDLRDARTLSVTVRACDGAPEVSDVVEGETEVRLAVTAAASSSADVGSTCAEHVTLKLAAPLGDRPVVDARSGRELTVWGRTRPTPIVSATRVGASGLLVQTATCNAQLEVTDVTETTAEVTIEVAATGGTHARECGDGVDVALRSPLGERRLVDATTGEVIPITGVIGSGA